MVMVIRSDQFIFIKGFINMEKSSTNKFGDKFFLYFKPYLNHWVGLLSNLDIRKKNRYFIEMKRYKIFYWNTAIGSERAFILSHLFTTLQDVVHENVQTNVWFNIV